MDETLPTTDVNREAPIDSSDANPAVCDEVEEKTTADTLHPSSPDDGEETKPEGSGESDDDDILMLPILPLDSDSEAEHEDMYWWMLKDMLNKNESEESAEENEIDADESVMADDEEEIVWSKDFTEFKGVRENFHEETGPKIKGDFAVDIFTQLWDQALMERIAAETNRHAKEFLKQESETDRHKQFPEPAWVDTTAAELYGLIAVMTLMTLDRMDDYLFSSEFGREPIIHKIMSKKRFTQLIRCLHFAENGAGNPSNSNRQLAKVKPIVDHLNLKFKAAYTPGRELVVAEWLLLWNGHKSWYHCARTKIARYGIRSYELSEAASGYVLNIILKEGAEPKSQRSVVKLNGAVRTVINLLEPYLGKGYTLFLSEMFTSVRLCKYLKSRRTDVVGMLDRTADAPDDIKRLQGMQLPRGTVLGRHCGDTSVVSCKRNVLLTAASTYHNADVEPFKKGGKIITRPVVINDWYKIEILGRDEKFSSCLLDEKPGIKWYVKTFRRLLSICIYNSYVIYKANNKHKRKMHYGDFCSKLARELFVQFCADSRHRLDWTI